MKESLGGDPEADEWISFLESIAYSLDRQAHNTVATYTETVSRKVRLRNLIDHPDTGDHERAAALKALHRLNAQPRS